jgi:GDP-L-fucose synthase
VLPALLRKFHDAKVAGATEVQLWGTGTAMREFLHVDDLARASLFLMEHYDGAEHVNVGTGVDCTVRELAEAIRDVVHPTAELVFDVTKPDGMPRKVLDIGKISALGWQPQVELHDGIRSTYEWYVAALASGDVRGLSELQSAS